MLTSVIACLRSLWFKDMKTRGKDIKQQASNTCSWILEHENYKSWLTQQAGLLWVKGKPGVGKSTLMKYALQQCTLEASLKNELIIASFFFHGRGSPLQRNSLGLFRSLIHQLLDQNPELLAQFTSVFMEKCDTEGIHGEQWDWHHAELQEHLQDFICSLLKVRPVRFYIDALDECGEEVAWDLVKFFQKLVLEPPDHESLPLQICFACRHYPIISFDDGLTICVEWENHDDIITYVRGELVEGDIAKQEAQRVEEEIVKSASGVFQWVVLVVPRVLKSFRDGRSIDEILAQLRRTPKQLENLYQEIFRNMTPDYRSESLQLMQWICFAQRPLSIPELRAAMAVDAGSRFRTLRECLGSTKYAKSDDQMEKRVKSLSGGLVEVIEDSDERIPQFVHQSVKDYLVSGGIQTLKERSLDSFLGQAHFQLSRACIRYIMTKEIRLIDFSQEPDVIRLQFPFLQYATTNWVVHAEKVETEGVAQEDLLDLLGWPANETMEIWAQLYQRLDRYHERCPPLETTLLHVGSRHGLLSLVAALILKPGTNTEPKDNDGRTPLSLAAEAGHEGVVRLLLEKGADIESMDNEYGQMPLIWAAGRGHAGIVQLLLENGADVESRDNKYGRTSLSWVAQVGNEGVLQVLLENGANIEFKDKEYGRTPLSWAAEGGHEGVVQLLLEKEAEIESKNEDDRTPLSWAAEMGHEGVVRLLLERKADIESKDKGYGHTPLSWAIRGGYKGVVQLLLEKGADIKSRDNYGKTPLWWAAAWEHEAIVQLLLEKGADVESRDDNSKTSLS